MSEIYELDKFRRVRDAMERMPEDCRRQVADEVQRFVSERKTAKLDRATRRNLWRKAETTFEFYQQLRALADVAKRAFDDYKLEDARPFKRLEEADSLLSILDKMRQAKAELLVTPAPYAEKMKWKKAERDRGLYFLPVKPERIDQVLAEDEAFICRNTPNRPQNRKRR